MPTTTSIVKNTFLSGITAAAIISYPGLTDLPDQYPVPDYNLHIVKQSTPLAQNNAFPENFYVSHHCGAVEFPAGSINEHIDVIHNFVSKLLVNTQDIDPQFSKIVDDHFWDLI